MLKNEARNLEELEIGALDISEIEEALGVVTRGMRDNPTHVAAFGEDPEVRARSIRRLFGGAFAVLDLYRHMLAARSADGAIIGVVGMLPPGECRPTVAQQLRLLPRLLSTGPRAAGRSASWMGTWSKHDPKERHWHLGPLAVDAHLQGMGIGSKLMRVFCAKMDAAGEDAYLETDKLINVRFYERFGFEVVTEQDVIGVTNWFMFRRAQGKEVGHATS
jgi:ribosomal protein S18 acetylase RimI-like enzyme